MQLDNHSTQTPSFFFRFKKRFFCYFYFFTLLTVTYNYLLLHQMYSPDKWEILAEVNSVACITIVSLIFGRKIASIDGPIQYVRGLLLALYGLSWAFNLIACMLTSTNNGNSISCLLTFYNVAIVYTASKIVLYLYFTEKVSFFLQVK